jgi:cytochrome c oxidase subunit 2
VGRIFSWSTLFLLVPILGVAVFVCALMTDSWPLYNHWFPVDVSKTGYIVDNLFYFILVLTGVIFVATGLVLFYSMWKFDGRYNTEPVQFSHGSHALEIVWSILPAATLLFIAIYQMDAWAAAKMRRPTEVVAGETVPLPPLAEVTGRQFEWRIRYPGKDGKLYTPDDLFDVNDLHVPTDRPIVLRIQSMDVLHSFFLPNVRLKQDVVPGMEQHVWFEATQTGQFDIVCAELCGWGHYKMKGRLTIESEQDYQKYLIELEAAQNQAEYEPSEEEDE